MDRETPESLLHANPLLAWIRAQNSLSEPAGQQDRAAFDQWLQEAETSDLPSFQTVAHSFRQDDVPISAALTMPWSTGQGEGQICRVKLLKRLGYGRAKLDLHRQRILHRTVEPVRPGTQRRVVKHPAAA